MIADEDRLTEKITKALIEIVDGRIQEIYDYLGVERVTPRPCLQKIAKPAEDVHDKFYRHGDKVLSQLETQLSDIMATAQKNRK